MFGEYGALIAIPSIITGEGWQFKREGRLTANDVVLRGGIQSQNYLRGERGWAFDPNGGGELDSALIRGGIVASSLTTEAIRALRITGRQITGLTINANQITAGVITADRISADVFNVVPLLTAGKAFAGGGTDFNLLMAMTLFDALVVSGWAIASGFADSLNSIIPPEKLKVNDVRINTWVAAGRSSSYVYTYASSSSDTRIRIRGSSGHIYQIWGIKQPKTTPT